MGSSAPVISTLPLHDALPILPADCENLRLLLDPDAPDTTSMSAKDAGAALERHRSEEHTSELQSRGHLVCRLLLEKKKKSRVENSVDVWNKMTAEDETN